MSDHPWGEGTGAACYECGEVGHFAKNCPYETFESAERRHEPQQPTHCPRCGHSLAIPPGHAEGCGSRPTTRLAEWVAQCRALLEDHGPLAGPALHFEALAQQQLAEARAGRLPEVAEVADDDDFPF